MQQLLLRHSVVYIQICPHDPWYVLVSVCLCVYGSDSVGGQERQTLRERERLELGWAGGAGASGGASLPRSLPLLLSHPLLPRRVRVRARARALSVAQKSRVKRAKNLLELE